MSVTTIIEASDSDRKPSKTRSLAGLGIALAAGTILSSVCTQYAASKLGHHPSLGEPLAFGIYRPWEWYTWSHAPWAVDHPTLFARVHLGMFGSALGIFILALVATAKRQRPRRYNAVHGTARFADAKDMQKSGFLDNDRGVYIGGWTDSDGRLRYLRHKGAEHVAAIAPTRSGKGVGLVIPTLLSYEASTVVYDEKGELWHLTAGFRSTVAGTTALRWQPGSLTESCRFNFLSAIRLGTPHEVSDAQNISMMLCDPDGLGLKDHWAQTAYALISGVILHECYKADAKGRLASLPDVADALSNPSRSSDELYKEMVKNQHLGDECHRFIAMEGRAQLNRDVKERTSVHSSAVTAMGLFKDPIVNANSRVSDFHISDLMDADKPVSLYICTPGTDKLRLRPLVRLMITVILSGLTGVTIKYDRLGRPVMPHKHRLLLMLDEFPSLGRLRVLESAMASIAGYGIKAYLIMQDRQQLLSTYTVNETILSNCHVQVAYAPNRYETAQWISGILGTYTANIEDFSESGKRSGPMSNVSHSIRQVKKDLLTPEQVMSLTGPEKVGDQIVSAGQMLVWAAGMKPRVLGTQILFFEDAEFQARRSIPPPPARTSIRNHTTAGFII